MPDHKTIRIREGLDGLVLEIVEPRADVCLLLREIHTGNPTKHIEEALECLGDILTGPDYTCEVKIKAAR